MGQRRHLINRNPEALLRHAEAEERAAGRGRLKVFLGYASGVGQSFRMFDEAARRHHRGEDVIVAAVQAVIPPEVAAIVSQLESVSASAPTGFPAIDVPAVLSRRPQLVVIDGLACHNPPGSSRRERYLDVDLLLDAGISVLTSIDLQDIHEQQAFVRDVTGVAPGAAVPQSFIQMADELVVVDAPPEAATRAGAQQLSRLRQRALLLTADVVERQLEAYLQAHGLQQTWGSQERIAVCMTPRANARMMLASGRRNADRFHGELFAIYVSQPHLTPEDRSALARNIILARAQQARVDLLEGTDPIRAILDYAHAHGVTQLFVGHNLRRTWQTRLWGSALERIIDDADGMDVRVFPH